MNDIINWNFAPPSSSLTSSKEWQASAYYQPRKKSPSYTIQLHSNAPKALLNANKVTFGKMNGSIVVTDSDKGNAYTVHGKGDATNAQINGKALVKSIAEHFASDNGTNMKMRLKLIPIGSPEMSLWEVKLYKID
jgi:hypothetical protein